MDIEVITPTFDPKRLAHDSMRKLYNLKTDEQKLKHLAVALQHAYEMGVEDGAKDETYFD